MPKVFTSEKQKIGEIGENIAVRFLNKRGFIVLERNYTKKCGEIDIVALEKDVIHFVEVKSVTNGYENVIRETEDGEYRPEDNMHPWKMKRLSRAIQTYLSDMDEDREWQVDLLLVFLDMENKKAKVKVVSDIVL